MFTFASSLYQIICPAQPPRALSTSIPRLPPPPSRNSANPTSSIALPSRHNLSRPTTPGSPHLGGTPGTTPSAPSAPSAPATSTIPRPGTAVEGDLPVGWEMRTATNGRQFYIDHNTRKTQWVCGCVYGAVCLCGSMYDCSGTVRKICMFVCA